MSPRRGVVPTCAGLQVEALSMTAEAFSMACGNCHFNRLDEECPGDIPCQDPADGMSPSDSSLPTLRATLPGAGIPQRPELALPDLGIHASQQQVRVQRAGLMPAVGLSIGYSHHDRIKPEGQLTVPSDGCVSQMNDTICGNSPMALLSANVPVCHPLIVPPGRHPAWPKKPYIPSRQENRGVPIVQQTPKSLG